MLHYCAAELGWRRDHHVRQLLLRRRARPRPPASRRGRPPARHRRRDHGLGRPRRRLERRTTPWSSARAGTTSPNAKRSWPGRRRSPGSTTATRCWPGTPTRSICARSRPQACRSSRPAGTSPTATISADHAEWVVKPTVSAGSMDTARWESPADVYAHSAALVGAGRTSMTQPYISSVDDEGETAMLFFGGEFSHAIRKGPILRARRGHPPGSRRSRGERGPHTEPGPARGRSGRAGRGREVLGHPDRPALCPRRPGDRAPTDRPWSSSSS